MVHGLKFRSFAPLIQKDGGIRPADVLATLGNGLYDLNRKVLNPTGRNCFFLER